MLRPRGGAGRPRRAGRQLRATERRSVAALLVAAACQWTAVLAQTTVLGKQVYDLTGRELDLGWVGLAEFAPAALLVLVTGAVADRLDRRRVAATAVLGEAGVALALAWYASTRPTSPGPIFLLVLVFGTCRAFAAPAARSLPADVVGPARLPWLVARTSITFQVGAIVGPVAAGALYAVDAALPYLAAAALFATTATCYWLVRPLVPEPAEVVPAATGPLAEAEALESAAGVPVAGDLGPRRGARAAIGEAVEGLRFVRRQPVLLGAISLDLFAVLFGGAVALLPAIADQRLGVGSVGLGWLRAAGGIGAGLVALWLAFRPVRRHVGRVLLVAVAVFGVGTIALGATRSYAVAFAAMVVLTGADAVSMFIRQTLVPLVTPADKRGRVLAVENVFIGASNELGAFESGVAGQALGPAGAVVLGGVATLAIAGTWWVRFPGLRDVDGFPGA